MFGVSALSGHIWRYRWSCSLISGLADGSPGMCPGRFGIAGSAGCGAVSGMMGGNHSRRAAEVRGGGKADGDGEAGPGGRERGRGGRGAGGGAGGFRGAVLGPADLGGGGIRVPGPRGAGGGDQPGGPGAGAAAAAGHVPAGRGPGGTGAAGHQRRRGPAPDRGGRPGTGPGQRLRPGAGHPDGLPARARGEPVPGRCPVGDARRPVLDGVAGPDGLPPGICGIRAGPGDHRGPDRGADRPCPAVRDREGPRRVDG